MIYVDPDSNNQQVVVTLKEKWKDFDTTPDSYLLKLTNTSHSGTYYVIPIVLSDNDRYTLLRINTNANAPTSGSIELEESGEYAYTIYGQTGTSNLDPDNAAVIGVFEIGTLFVNAVAYTEDVDDTAIPNTFIDQ
jgi:hypothetical protein